MHVCSRNLCLPPESKKKKSHIISAAMLDFDEGPPKHLRTFVAKKSSFPVTFTASAPPHHITIYSDDMIITLWQLHYLESP